MNEIIQVFPFGAFFVYFIVNLLGKSFLVQKTFKTDLSPKFVRGNVPIAIFLICDATFIYFCYELLTLPSLDLWIGIGLLILIRIAVGFLAKMRAVGVYCAWLKEAGLLTELKHAQKHPLKTLQENKHRKWWKD